MPPAARPAERETHVNQDSRTAHALLDDSPREPETRARILDAAIECFSQFGNEKTTLNDVARVAGLSRQTIYRYFPDRAALLEAVDAFEEERMGTEARRLAEESGSFEAFVAGLAARQAATANRYRTRQHLLGHDRGLFQSLFLSQSRVIDRFKSLVAPQLAAARSRGEIHAGIDVDEAAEWIAIALAGVIRLTQASTFDLDDPDDVGRYVARHLCHGLVADAPTRPRPRRRRH